MINSAFRVPRRNTTCFHLKDRAGTWFATDNLYHGHSKPFLDVIIATMLLCKSSLCTVMHGN